MNAGTSKTIPAPEAPEDNGKSHMATQATHGVVEGDDEGGELSVEETAALERRLLRKIDLRLCTIAGILCSLNLLDR